VLVLTRHLLLPDSSLPSLVAAAGLQTVPTIRNNVFNSATLYRTGSETQYKLFAVANLGGAAASGLAQASGVFDPRATNGQLRGKNKALGICEVCWFLSDEAPDRDDLALQPAGLIESNVYTSTVPS
jgi:hypothetical protein